ncbi:hypothetical protein F0562_028695 [Nyssa sinensis]|uniref:Uncharacterized protein n=1 Tax=Nyssa sinensis TaxID=561372 RepID=A0A5J5B356_9ASTE|nr:hypothetical protein F0562_028695 [Nyssa sinensis]
MRLGLTGSFAHRQHAGGEYRRHPPRRLREVPAWSVHQNYIPCHLVYVVGKVVYAQFAVGEEKVLYRPALVSKLFSGVVEKVVQVAHSGRELNVVSFNFWVFFFELGDQAENEEVTGGGAAAEDGGDGVELGGGQPTDSGGIEGRGIVEESVEDGFGQRGVVPGGGGGGDFGGGNNVSGGDESEKGGECEEGDNDEKP